MFVLNSDNVSDYQRVPILIGGNINNIPFLRLYDVDFVEVSSTLTVQKNFVDIVKPSIAFDLRANVNNGKKNQHRMQITAPNGVGSKFFIKEFSDCYLSYCEIN